MGDRFIGSTEGSQRIRVMLLLSSLHGGGAERVAVHLLNRSDESLLDVRMGLLRRSGPFLPDADESRIAVSPVGERFLKFEGHNSSFYRPHKLLAGGILAPLNVARMMRDFRPHVVMSFLKGMSVITYAALKACGRQRPRWIAREGNNTFAVIADELSHPAAKALVTRVTSHCYRAADCFLANSHHMAQGLEKDLALDPTRVRVIHNPIDLANVRQLSKESLPGHEGREFIVTAGRLEFQKGHDLLLRAFAASAACRNLDLLILGRGTREAELKQLAAELGIGDRVHFRGFQENPWAWFSRAKLFVLPSRWEGFPSVVAEALACGVPALVTDCEFGPKEVVEHGISGWVVPPEDVDAFRNAMDAILTNPELSRRLAGNGPARAARFGIDEMLQQYASLFAEQAMHRHPAYGRG
jgi:glycosyltransferase involved in cell wall biosynthesis